MADPASERTKARWGLWGAFVMAVFMAGVIGAIDHVGGSNHVLGNWAWLIGGGAGAIGYLLGRAAA